LRERRQQCRLQALSAGKKDDFSHDIEQATASEHLSSTQEIQMKKSPYAWLGAIAVLAAVAVSIGLLRPREALAQGQYPIVDKIAAQVVGKYQSASCEQLWQQKAAHAPPSMEEQRAIAVLKGDPQMRAAFINQIAPPIANKMFDCGMIP
jgi:hypothetical protein